jgi:hypothetical protein
MLESVHDAVMTTSRAALRKGALANAGLEWLDVHARAPMRLLAGAVVVALSVDGSS